MRGTLTFRPLGISRVSAIAFLGALSMAFFLLGAVVLVTMLIDWSWSWGGAAFVAFVAFFIGWNGYWYLYRYSFSTTFDGYQLHWQTGLASGSMPLDEIENIRSRYMMIEICSANDKIALLPSIGYRVFLDEILAARRDLTFTEKATIPVSTLSRETLTFEPWAHGG